MLRNLPFDQAPDRAGIEYFTTAGNEGTPILDKFDYRVVSNTDCSDKHRYKLVNPDDTRDTFQVVPG